MQTTTPDKQTVSVIKSAELLSHWQGHRNLTRKVIEVFPEKELFEYSVGGMRPFAKMVQEMLGMEAPGIKQVAGGEVEDLNEDFKEATNKASLLGLWDKATEDINRYWAEIPDGRFHETMVTFGKYEGTVWFTVFYLIDNGIHHRAQAYVYLRSLGVTPPAFWER